MKFTELTYETIQKEFCPKCEHYIDKQFLYRDRECEITIAMGTVKDCKFHTNEMCVCDYREKKKC